LSDGSAITSLKYEFFPVEFGKILVVLCTQTKLYQFIGYVNTKGSVNGIFADLFANVDPFIGENLFFHIYNVF